LGLCEHDGKYTIFLLFLGATPLPSAIKEANGSGCHGLAIARLFLFGEKAKQKRATPSASLALPVLEASDFYKFRNEGLFATNR